jgi:hypothetical protein
MKELFDMRNRYLAQCILNKQYEALIDELNRFKLDQLSVNDTLIKSN